MFQQKLYDAAATRAIDANAINEHGIAGLTLMQRAGGAAYAELKRRWPAARNIAIVCGTGNNGGDGFVVAQLAHRAGQNVEVFLVGEADAVRGDARTCMHDAIAAGIKLQALPGHGFGADVVVDALLGTGLDRPVGGQYAAAIAAINDCTCPCLAIDIPSGLNASSGRVLGSSVRADVTVTFIAIKQGLLTGEGPALCGDVVAAGLSVPASCYDAVQATAWAIDYAACADEFQARRRDAHKGDFGHVLIVGGAPGFAGAARLAAEAAARCGAGLVSLATHPGHASSVTAGRPEIMCHAVADAAALRALCARASVIAIGPGLGQSSWARALFATVVETRLPLVIDADGLNLLAEDGHTRSNQVLTPHPGEAARLLGSTTARVQDDRFAAARAIAERYGGAVILKGAGSVVYESGALPAIVRAGNPGMASGGMGDVLTGVVAGLLAQGCMPFRAAALGACVHAHAADCAAIDGGERGLLAGDLATHIRRAVNPLQ